MTTMTEPGFFKPASHFLEREITRLGEEPGLTSLPPGPERDFLTLTWGPVVFRATYAPDSERLFPIYLRALNEEIQRAVPKHLQGSPEQMLLLQRTYSSKVFSDKNMYDNADVETVRQAFHDWKVSLGLPAMDLPIRLKFCLMIDDGCLATLAAVTDQASSVETQAEFGAVRIIIVEEEYPQKEKQGASPPPEYPGWVAVSLAALVEVYSDLDRDKSLSDFYRKNQLYKGNGEWVPVRKPSL
ncbi:hypothetical protein DTO164E3_4667 [Paecilomyces variotii]|nr:hypothetical protein DTO164E3_4667 [Paecilomyces variotii]KAJ9204519.1 hypothetical protein DTO032I3_2774 [Paecilomyces variotii]KAJ9224165.1 hypothetical protein DTO169C6_3525 [Paecilomyces variotii]KAJ9232386.1 hypothetical protein DTO169E5_7510 [Paecilomyces variotii]KAJ9248700.1 hypothetical protein DTO207G8_7184 [Paecilomyces variotii]